MDIARDALWVVDYLSMRPDVLQEPTFANERWHDPLKSIKTSISKVIHRKYLKIPGTYGENK